MKRTFFIILILASIRLCAQESRASIFDFSDENAEEVSIIQLIANPEKYEGKIIAVQGFLSLEVEGQAIYLNKNDYEYFNRKNGITVLASIQDGEKKELHLKEVKVIGKFQKKLYNTKTAWSGWLITKKIYLADNREQIEKIRKN